MGVNNIYSVGVDIRPAKKAFDELFDQYEELSRKIGQGIGTEGFSEQIEEMKSAIAEIAKSLTGISKTKVNNETFGSFSKDITGQIDSLNARTTVLEETVGKLISTMSEADGGSFKKWIASVKKEVDGLNLVAEKTTDIMRNVATQNSTKQPIKLVDSNTVAETKAELQDLIKRINALQDTARESEIINISSITDAKKQLKGAINEAEALKKTLSNMSISDTDYSSIQLKYVSALERVYDISGSVQEKFGDIGDSAINKLVDSAVALTDHLDPLINNVQAQIRRLTSISIPIDISTTTKELKDKVASIISTLQSTASKKPIEIEFVLVSSKRYRDFGEALKVFQQQIEQIPHEADRAAMESIAEDLRSGMVNQINFGIKTSLADAAVAARSIIAKIRSELKSEPIVIEPEIKLGKEQIENYTAEINALSERLSNIVTDAVGKGLAARKTDSSGGTGDSLTVLKRRTGELSVLLNKTLPESVLKFNNDLKLLDENKMGSANAKALADNLNLAYSALKKILDLASNNNSLFNLLSDWRESDLILEQFKDRKAMLERSAILGSDNKIYGGYVYDRHGGTVGSNYTKLPSGVSAVTDIHSHSSDHIAALSNGDIEAWAYDVVNKGIKDALVVAIDDVEHFYAADFFNEAKGRGVDFNDQDIQNTLKDNFSLMLKHIKEHSLEFLYDAIEKYGGITLGDFANKFAKPIEDYWGSEGFHFDSNLFVNAFKEIVDGGDYKDAVEAVNAALVNSIKNQAGKSLTLKDVKDVTQYLNIPEMMGLSKFFEDPRNLFSYQVRRLTPMTFNGGFGKDLGVGDLFEKYIHYYTHDEFKEANPLNLSSSQFDDLFKNTGVESFVKNIEQAVAALEPLTQITSALSNISGGDSLQNLIPEELVTNVTTVATSLSQLTEILGETGSIKIDTSPLKDLSKTLYELSDVVQRYTGLSSASNLESAFADIKTTASAISNLDFRRKESKNAVLELVEQYYDYLRRGGTSGVGEITENKSLKAQINKIYDDSIAQSARAAAKEAPAINQVKISATDAAGAKKQFAEANGQLLESIVKSLDGLNNEGKAFENLNKLLNNLGGKNGDVKLEKTKKALETIYNVMNSSIGADSFIKELENLASSGDALKDLADVIKASKSQVSSATKAIKGDEIETRRNQSQELIRDYAADLKTKAEDELKALYGKEVPYLSLQIDRQGFIEATGYIKDLGASAEELQVVKMRLNETGDFITTSLSSANVQAMKYQQFLDRLHAAAKLPDHITDEIVFDKNTDSDVWSVLLDHAQQYYGFIGNLQKVTRQVRQDASGNLLESFTFLGDKGHVTMGREGDEVASHQDLINLQEIVDRYQKLISISQKYYELKYKNAEGRASEYEVRAIQDVEDEYKRLIALVQEVNNTATIGKDNIAQKAFESFNNDFNRNFDQALDAKIQAFQKSLTKQEITRSNQRNEFTTAFQNEINQAKEAISVIRSLRESYANGQMFWSDTDLKTVFEGLEKMQSVMDRFQDRTGIAALTSDVDKLITKIQTDLNNNNIKGNLRDQYSDLLNTLNQVRVDADATKEGIASIDKVTLGKLQGQFQGLHAEMLKTGQDGKGFFKQFSTSITSQSANFLARYFSFYSIIRYGRQIAQTVNQIDTSMKELQKVSSATNKQMAESFKNSTATAKEYGATITDVINSTADWSRLGYSLPESEELARVTTLYQNIAKGVDQSHASEYLVSTLQGFNIQASEAEGIVDRINKVANNFAIDQAGIGEALERSAASFNAAGTDLSKAIALVTATNETLQNPESVGTMWKTFSARLRGAKTELSELGEEEDAFTKTTSKLRDLVKQLTGFDIMIDDTQYKDLYEIVLGIGEEWENLTDIERASLGEALAGKRNSNAFYALMNNIDHLQDAYKAAENSAGDAEKSQEIYASSVQFSIDRAKASIQELSNDFLNSDFLKGAIDSGNKFINVLDNIVKAIGPVGSLVGVFGISSGIKGAVSRRPNGSLLSTLFNGLADRGAAQVAASAFNKQFDILSGAASAYNLQKTMVTSGNLVDAIAGFDSLDDAARALNRIGIEGKAAEQWLGMAFKDAGEEAIAASVAVNSMTKETTGLGRAGLALKGLLSNPVTWGVAAIAAAVIYVKVLEKQAEDLRKIAVEVTDKWKDYTDSVDDSVEKVKSLRTELDKSTTTDEEAISLKQQIYQIQSDIIDQYGQQVHGIDLVNGDLTEQLNIIKDINKEKAKEILNEGAAGFQQAHRDATTKGIYAQNVGQMDPQAYEDIERIAGSIDGVRLIDNGIYLSVTHVNAMDVANELMDRLDELMETSNDESYKQTIQNTISAVSKIIKDNKDTWQNTIDALNTELEAKIVKSGGEDVLTGLKSAVSDYNEALKSGDEKAIDATRIAYEKAIVARDEFFNANNLDLNLYNDYFKTSEYTIDEFAKKVSDAAKVVSSAMEVLNNPAKDIIDEEIAEYEKELKEVSELGFNVNQTVFGNVDLGKSRGKIVWDDETIKKYKFALKSWDEDAQKEYKKIVDSQGALAANEWLESYYGTLKGKTSTVYGGSNTFLYGDNKKPIQIAYTPIVKNPKNGQLDLVGKYTIYAYIQKIVDAATDEAGNIDVDKLIKLDQDGLDGFEGYAFEIKNIIADVGEQAEKTSLAMHYLGEDGSLNLLLRDIDHTKRDAEIYSDDYLDLDVSPNDDYATKQQKVLQKSLNMLRRAKYDKTDFKSIMSGKTSTKEAIQFRRVIEQIADILHFDIRSDTDIAALLQLLVDKGVIAGDVVDNINKRTNELSSVMDDAAENVGNLITNLDKVNSLISGYETGKSISAEDYTAFFNDSSMKDYLDTIELVNGALVMNADKVRELAKAKAEEQIATNDANKAAEQSEYLKNAQEIQRLNDELRNNKNLTKEEASEIRRQIDAATKSNDEIVRRCEYYDVLSQSIRETTGAYQEWLAAQNAATSGDMFSDATNALNVIREVFTEGSDTYLMTGKGNTHYQAAVDFLIPEEVSKEGSEAVEKYLKSLNYMLEKDDDGKIVGLNIAGFLDKAVENGLMQVIKDESGEEFYEIAGMMTMEQFAEGMGLALPLVQAVFGQLNMYENSFSWLDETSKTIGDLAVAAEEAKKSLTEDFGLKTFKFQTDVSDIQNASVKIETLEETIREVQKLKKMHPEMDTEQLEEANSIIEYCVAQIQLLERPIVFDIDTTTLTEAEKEVWDLVTQLMQASNEYRVAVELGMDPIQAETKMNEILSELQQQDPEILAKFGINNPQDSAQEVVSQIQESDPTIEGNFVIREDGFSSLEDKEINLTANDQITDKINKINRMKLNNKTLYLYINGVSTIINKLDEINNKRLEDKILKVRGEERLAQGTAHVNGTAFVNGNAKLRGDWGMETGQRVLIGELGPEIVVDPATGKWRTYGDNGAEFAYIPKNAIVFNHLQTQSLLKQGWVNSRATAMASGTAFVGGGISKSTADKTKKKKNSDSSSSSSNKSSSNSSTKAAEETAENLKDWVEVLLNRIAKTFEDFKSMADYWTTYINKNRELNNAIDQAFKNIADNQKAYQRYMQEANNVGLSDSYKKKVQSGELNIENIKDEKLREKVEKYQEWYDKALAVKDTIRDLNKEIYELSRQKIENLIGDYESFNEYTQAAYENASKLNELYTKRVGRGNKNNLAQMAKQQNNLYVEYAHAYKRIQDEMNAQLANGTMKKNSEAYRKARTDLVNLKNAMLEVELEIYNINEAIREVNWKNWENALKMLEHVDSQIGSTVDLIGDLNNYNEDNARITDAGIAKYDLYSSALANARQKVANLNTAIATLDKEFKEGVINEQEYNEQMQEYREQQMAAAGEVKKHRDAIISLIKEGIEAETKAMEKLTDARKEALKKQKEADDYARSVSDKTTEINKIRAKIAAMAGDDTMATQAKVAKLREELANKEEDLARTRQDHEYDEMVKALDDGLEAFKETQDEKTRALSESLANQEAAIENSLSWTTTQYKTTYDELTEISRSFGIDLEDFLTKPWKSATAAAKTFEEATTKAMKSNAGISTTGYQNIDKNKAADGTGSVGAGNSYVEGMSNPTTDQKKNDNKKSSGDNKSGKKIAGSFSGASLYSGALMKKSDVEYLQKLLNAVMGTNMTVDGIFGPVTENAVKAFQSKYGIGADGVFGKKSRAKMLEVAKKLGYARRGKRNARGLYITDEQGLGSEAIITKEGVLRQLDSDTVFSKKQTEALWNISKMSLDNAMKVSSRGANVNITYGSLLTVTGDVTKDALPGLEEILKKACEYTKRDITASMSKLGFR